MKKASNIVTIIYSILFAAIILYGVIGQHVLPSESQNLEGFCESYEEGWSLVQEDGSTIPADIHDALDIGTATTFSIQNTLPEIFRDDAYIIVRSSKQDIQISIDGVLRRNYTTRDSRWFGKSSPAYYIFVNLLPQDAGKTITLHYESIPQYAGLVSEIFYSNYNGFMSYMLETQGFLLVVAIIMLVISLIALSVSVIMNLIYKQQQKLTGISAGVLVVSFWLIGNSVFRQFIFPNVSIIGELTFLMVALMPLPFASYINQIQGYRYEKAYMLVKILTVVDVIGCSLAYILGRMDFSESFYAMITVLGILIILLVTTIILDIVRGYIMEYFVIALALIVAGAVLVTQVIIYLQTDKTFDISVAAIGLFIMLFVAIVDAVNDVYKFRMDKRKAQMESASKSQFLANMSHEIRTPINSMLGMDTMILRECKDDNIRQYALDIQSAGKSLLSIVNDILDFSKIESGKMALVHSHYDMGNLLEDALEMIRTRADEKGLQIITEVDESIPRGFLGDDVRINQILMNLLTNAVKYTPEGKVTLSVQKDETVKDKSGELTLVFSVKDTGIGIREEDIAKLTEEFVRIEESRNRNIEGTGLGINIVVSLLKLMGSTLEVNSVYGKGSDFHFKLRQTVTDETPIGKLEKKIESPAEKQEYVPAFSTPNASFLVVDDNAMNRKVFQFLLRDLQGRIDEAESGKQCLELVKKNKYDIIFMDHMMPELDGVETFRIMKGWGKYLNSDTPVVVLTANAINGAREEYMQEGFDDYMSKPIVPAELEQLIGRLIAPDKKQTGEKLVIPQEMKREDLNLPFVDGVDWDVALNKLLDVTLLLDTIKDFLTMAKVELKDLTKMYDSLEASAGAMENFRIKVHAMKSNAATIGALHVAGLAKFLEYAARDQDTVTIQQLMPTFSKEWLNLKGMLEEAFDLKEADGDEDKPPIEKDFLEECLGIIAAAMEELDVDRADTVMAELKEYSYQPAQKELLEQLDAYVLNMDTEASLEVIETWRDINK